MAQLNNYFLLFGNAISNVMTPRVHRLVAENAPMRTLDALFTRVGRLQFILLGGILLGIIETFSKAYLSPQFSDAIVFAVLIVILLVKPAGLLGKQVQEKV